MKMKAVSHSAVAGFCLILISTILKVIYGSSYISVMDTEKELQGDVRNICLEVNLLK